MKNRQTGIELLRILGMFLIMQYHYINHGGILLQIGVGIKGINAFCAKMMCMGGK